MGVKLTQALEVSLGYLTSNSDIEYNKATLDRVQEVTKLSDKDKKYIFVTLDALIRDFKNKQEYAKLGMTQFVLHSLDVKKARTCRA